MSNVFSFYCTLLILWKDFSWLNNTFVHVTDSWTSYPTYFGWVWLCLYHMTCLLLFLDKGTSHSQSRCVGYARKTILQWGWDSCLGNSLLRSAENCPWRCPKVGKNVYRATCSYWYIQYVLCSLHSIMNSSTKMENHCTFLFLNQFFTFWNLTTSQLFTLKKFMLWFTSGYFRLKWKKFSAMETAQTLHKVKVICVSFVYMSSVDKGAGGA